MEIDNNLVESAIIYSLLGSCKALGIDTDQYLRDTFEALPAMTNQTAPG